MLGAGGKLLDGQHRLHAVIEAGLPIQSVVVYGMDDEAFRTMDTGKARTGGDTLSVTGVGNHNHIAAAIRRIMDRFGSKRMVVDRKTVRISNSAYLSFYEENKKDIDDLWIMCHTWAREGSKIISVSEAMAYIFLLREEDMLAYDFIEEVLIGLRKNPKSNAAQTLRKKIVDSRLSNQQIRDAAKMNWFLSAFRNYVAGRNVSKIIIRKPFRFLAENEQDN